MRAFSFVNCNHEAETDGYYETLVLHTLIIYPLTYLVLFIPFSALPEGGD